MKSVLLACLLVASSPVLAAEARAQGPVPEKVEVYQSFRLAAGTPVELAMAQTVTTKGDGWDEGDEFALVVSEDVRVGAYVVIPKGTPARGHVRRSSGPGAFGKSGKIEVEIDYLVLGKKRLKLVGLTRAEGRGELTSVGRVAAAGLLAVFIKGDDGEIVQGSQIIAYLGEDLGVVIPYREQGSASDDWGSTMVRARRIDVSEAFKDMPPPSGSDQATSPPAKRITVEEAFKDELPPKKSEK